MGAPHLPGAEHLRGHVALAVLLRRKPVAEGVMTRLPILVRAIAQLIFTCSSPSRRPSRNCGIAPSYCILPRAAAASDLTEPDVSSRAEASESQALTSSIEPSAAAAAALIDSSGWFMYLNKAGTLCVSFIAPASSTRSLNHSRSSCGTSSCSLMSGAKARLFSSTTSATLTFSGRPCEDR